MQQPHDTIPAHSQNFLRSGALIERLLDTSTIHSGDLVFDLGAGTGVISARLARRGCDVVAVEKDAWLADHLRVRFAGIPNVQVCQCDVLHMRLPHRAYKVFANIPFDATSAIVSRLTRAACPPEDAYLVMQHEAAERFIGQPRTSLPAVLLFPWFEATLFHAFRRTDFTPAPRVEVVMLRLRKRGPPLVGRSDAQLYRDFVVYLFTGRRLWLRNRLRLVVGKRRGDRLARALDIGDASPMCIPAPRWLELFNATRTIAANELSWSVAHAERRLREQQHRLHKVHRTRSHRLRPPPLAWAYRPGPHRFQSVRTLSKKVSSW
jgi:23S rRNA (adenine-N6)-dimethyltransferase